MGYPNGIGGKVCRGVRGATTVTVNTREAILTATRELLRLIIKANGIAPDDVASAFFTTTLDLNADYPAIAARQLGWLNVALMCAHEMAIPHGLPQCIRVLVHWNTTRAQNEVHHVYIRGAEHLRPDRKMPIIVEDDELDALYPHGFKPDQPETQPIQEENS
ncbi:MAG TPA: chorismate mutase [Aggregatilineales bacterium]|nr:chorismate mutase [Anaerolineales bacterium]HRE48983.1 chorismate mutase [Aggregatilineales bacterium]